MSAPLHLSFIALVLVNLCFVAITDVVAAGGLLVMGGATLLSPWLRRWVGRPWYHGVWNLVVILGFVQLLRHALNGGLHLLLEDGLRLAALCQVHLVSTLHRGHRRDLLFFNSFLIPVVTSFLCSDTPFSVALLAYTPVLSIALHLNVLESSHPRRHGWRRAVVQGGLRGGVVLLGGFLAFFLVPRDFEHRGLMKADLEWDRAKRFLEVDFEEEIQLGNRGPVRTDPEPVFHVQRVGDEGEIPAYWRGATSDRFTGTAWVSTGRVAPDWRWTDPLRGPMRRGPNPAVQQFRVEARAPLARAFLPPEAVELSAPDPRGLTAHPDGTVELGRRIRSYQLGLAPATRAPGAAVRRSHGPLFEIPPGTLSDRSREILQQFGARGGAQTAAEMAERIETRIRARYSYVPPGEPDSAATLEEFLGGEKGGHCEWFATALALALRLQDLPCRVVTGYRSTEQARTGRLVVRRSHAHAWVEVYDPETGWRTLDATPAAHGVQLVASGGWWSRLRRSLDSWWVSITGFDESVRTRLWQRSLSLGGAFLLQPGALGAMLGLYLLWWALRLDRRRRAVPASVRALRSAAKAARVPWLPHETPRELLRRASSSDSSSRPQQLRRLEEAVLALETERYA